MKTLSFNFLHPVKGIVNLIPLAANTNKKFHFAVDSKGRNLLEVPLDTCGEGRWEIVLDWEYNGQNYSHHKEFEIKNGNQVY
jgi:hypothetical protein